jgi:branched-chain amino acid transport system ATP-binding protein
MKNAGRLDRRGPPEGQGSERRLRPFLVLRDLTLEVRPGLTVILGPNGAGKTTLLKALNGLIPRQGEVLLDGEVLPDADATRSSSAAWPWCPKGASCLHR